MKEIGKIYKKGRNLSKNLVMKKMHLMMILVLVLLLGLIGKRNKWV
jgi:hypothetical protein